MDKDVPLAGWSELSLDSMTASIISSSITFGLYIYTRHNNQLHITTMERSLLQCTRALSRCTMQASCRNLPKCRPSAIASARQARCLHTTRPALLQSKPPRTRDRGPKSDEDTQTDFSALDVLRNTVAPATSIDACTGDGFALNNQMRISGCGILLIGGEAYRWKPWLREGRKEGTVAEGGTGDDAMTGKLLNAKGQWEVPEQAWGVLELLYPKPGTFVIACNECVTNVV